MAVIIDGTTGIDKVQDGAITVDDFAAGAVVTSVNGQTGAVTISAEPTTAQVLAATAGASAGAVGTYAFLHINTNNTTISTGSTRAGSGLIYASIFPWAGAGTSTAVGQAGSGSPSGTWRCMGLITAYNNANYRGATVWLRIS